MYTVDMIYFTLNTLIFFVGIHSAGTKVGIMSQ